MSTDTQTKARENPSRVRDHLANERTYLAWMRTAISLMGFGVVIVRLRPFHPPLLPHLSNAWKLGFLFSLVGAIAVLLSSIYYFVVRRTIDDDTYDPSTRRILFFSVAVGLLAVGAIYFAFISPLTLESPVVPQ